jgi:glycogen operon protein
VDDSFLIMFNAHHEPIDLFIPDLGLGDNWRIELDTAAPRNHTDRDQTGEVVTVRTKEWLTVAGRSVTAISMTAAA